MKQPEALRLADALDDWKTPLRLGDGKSAAAELRRLHALNAELVDALDDAADLICTYGGSNSDQNQAARTALSKAKES